MTSSEDLVPKGLPQGSRQETEAAMTAAGLPLGSEGAAPPPVPAAPPPAGPVGAPPVGATVPARQQMANFDVFGDRSPSAAPAPDQREVVDAQVRLSANAVMQEVFSRMSGYREE